MAGGFGNADFRRNPPKAQTNDWGGGRPILWHIMKTYSEHGINDFIICCGYMGYVIKEYFAITFFICQMLHLICTQTRCKYTGKNAENWRVTLIDTGANTMTGGRLRRVAEYLDPNQPFCFTYGDGVSDVNALTH